MSASDPIRHVVLLMLENRSFDQMLGDLKSVNAGIEGIDPDKPGSNIDPKTSTPIPQQSIAEYALPDKVDLGHEPNNVDNEMDLAGTPMSGFVREFRQNNLAGADDDIAKQVMAYFPIGRSGAPDTLPVLHTLAREFTVCDRWFSSLPGPTWPNRLFALTGTSAGWRRMPNGLHISGPPYVYGQETIFNRFADHGLRARAYCDGTSMTWILRQTWLHPSWRQGLQDFFADAKGNETNFPAFAFIEPNYFGETPDDEHPPHDVRRGEALIANVYNAIRANQALWESTLLVVVYDEHGGFYDHVVPPQTIAPDSANQDNFPFTQLGVRVPCVLVSPWLPRGVSHTQFDHTSLLRYMCEKWDLQPLGLRAQNANSVSQAFANMLAAAREDADTPRNLVPPDLTQAAGPSSVVSANQAALATSIDAMHSELGLSQPATRALDGPPSDPQILFKCAYGKVSQAESKLRPLETNRLIKVLGVHGVGHADKSISWQDDWRKTIIAQVRSQPGAQDWNVDVEFTSYDTLFDASKLTPETIADAVLRLAGGLVAGASESPQRDLLDSLGKVKDELRWTAGMVVQWIDDDKLRSNLRERLSSDVQRIQPDLIAAHSLGSLIAYDLFRRDIAAGNGAQYKAKYLLTFGSQIAHPAVLPVFDGRVEPLTVDGNGFAQWFHLYNEDDLVFTEPLPIADDRTSTLGTNFFGLTNGSNDPLSHNAVSYLSHPGASPAWSAITVFGQDVTKSLGVPVNASSIANDNAPAIVRTVPSRQRALLVGINQYPDPKNRLEGCVNDVFLMSSVLQEFGFDPDAIRVVLDERATKAGIEERFEWLMDDVQKGDVRVFFYSGHGARIPTYDAHAAPDGYEESLVPYDFDWSKAHAFTDTDFRQYYAQLPYDAQFFSAFDCCHAGGMARGSLRPRGLDPPDDIRHRMLKWSADDKMWVPRTWVPKQQVRPNCLFVPDKDRVKSSNSPVRTFGQAAEIRSLSDRDGIRKDYGHDGPYLPLMMFACGEGQLASEYEHGATSYGAFSFVFAKTLREQKNKRKTATLKRLVSLSATELSRLGYSQTPEIVGPKAKYDSDTLLSQLF